MASAEGNPGAGRDGDEDAGVPRSSCSALGRFLGGQPPDRLGLARQDWCVQLRRAAQSSAPAPTVTVLAPPLAVKLWNTIGECKLTLDDGHADWVSAVRFSPSPENPIFVSASWDKTVKVWSLTNFKLRADLVGHTGYISAVTVSPDGSLCASGGKDGIAMLWDLNEGKRLYSLEAGTISAWEERGVGGRGRPCSTSPPALPCSPLPLLLPQPLLALRRDVQEHHHLGPR